MSPSLAVKSIINLIWILTIWWRLCVVILGCWKGYLLWPACYFDKTLLAFASSFCTPRPNLPVTLGISWLPAFAFQFSLMKRTSFFLLLFLEGVVGLHSISQLPASLASLGHRLGLLWCWMVCLGNEPRSSSIFEVAPNTAFQSLLLTLRATPFFSKGFLPTGVDIMVIWNKFAHSCPF